MKYLIIGLIMVSSVANAKSIANGVPLANIPEFACFEEIWQMKPQLPWEKRGTEHSKPHMMIRKSADGMLFAQPVPGCSKRTSCGYWIRSFKYDDVFFTGTIVLTKCPKNLSKKIVLDLIKTEYKNQYTLDYGGPE